MRISAALVLRFSALVGVCASLYALYVEHELHAARVSGMEYVAACDLGRFASCSKVFGSSYGHILSHWQLVEPGTPLDISTAGLGLIYYVVALVHDYVPLPTAKGLRTKTELHANLMVAAAVGSLGFTLYLAYTLKFVLRDFCIVCGCMYIANISIFLASVVRMVGRASRQVPAKRD